MQPLLKDLLDEPALEQTSTVANCRMNRERELTGSNGYEVELDFALVDWLRARGPARWLDLCCGTGRALLQAEALLPELELVGVDLVDFFWPRPEGSRVQLVVSPLRLFEPQGSFALVTCVHGLHYVGDKLALLHRMTRWLGPTGQMRAHLDLDEILLDGEPLRARELRQAGFRYDPATHLVSADGPTERLPWRFVGARPGPPNYTGQPSVQSGYA